MQGAQLIFTTARSAREWAATGSGAERSLSTLRLSRGTPALVAHSTVSQSEACVDFPAPVALDGVEVVYRRGEPAPTLVTTGGLMGERQHWTCTGTAAGSYNRLAATYVPTATAAALTSRLTIFRRTEPEQPVKVDGISGQVPALPPTWIGNRLMLTAVEAGRVAAPPARAHDDDTARGPSTSVIRLARPLPDLALSEDAQSGGAVAAIDLRGHFEAPPGHVAYGCSHDGGSELWTGFGEPRHFLIVVALRRGSGGPRRVRIVARVAEAAGAPASAPSEASTSFLVCVGPRPPRPAHADDPAGASTPPLLFAPGQRNDLRLDRLFASDGEEALNRTRPFRYTVWSSDTKVADVSASASPSTIGIRAGDEPGSATLCIVARNRYGQASPTV